MDDLDHHSNNDTNMKDRRNSLILSEQTKPEYPGFGILGRYPITSLLLFASLGIGTGLGLMSWQPTTEEDQQAKETTIKWIGLFGDLFIRALKCVVLPLIFFSVVIAVVDMMKLGRASAIAWRTIGFYVLTTVMAALIGVFSTLMWKGYFTYEYTEPPGPAMISLGCNEDGSFLTEMPDGSLLCTKDYSTKDDTEFRIVDITKTYVTKEEGPVTLSLSDTIYQGIFHKIVPTNIVASFSSGNFAAVIFFALIFGFALGKVMRENKRQNILISLFQEINDVFVVFINWIIMLTPFAVWSLIATALGRQDDAVSQFRNVGFLVAAILTGQAIHVFLLWFVTFYLVTRWNPFTYLKNIIPAQTMAFACSSSAATIPVTLQSVRNTGRVPEAILRFVVPLGATINMDGTAIGYPITCIWLAVLNGIQPTAASYVLLVIISTIGSIGSAPIPSAGLVLIITAYNTVFNATGIPEGFGYVVAIDWFLDRLETAINVTGDSVVCAFVSKTTKLEDVDKGLPNDEMLKENEKRVEDDYSAEDIESNLSLPESHSGKKVAPAVEMLSQAGISLA